MAVFASIVWAFIVWYGGEGMNMLLTGTASVLTGAPGAVLLYPLLGLAVYPRKQSTTTSEGATRKAGDDGLLSRRLLRSMLAGFWYFSQAFGMILTGMATDFNSGLLVVVMALACWQKVHALSVERARVARSQRASEESGSAQHA